MVKSKFTYDSNTYDTIENLRFIQTTFVIRTITTLFWQFLFTFGMVTLTVYNQTLNTFITLYMNKLLLLGFIGSFGTLVYIINSSPKTILQLSLFTIFETMLLCAFSALQEPETIIVSTVVTFGLTIGLGIYALTTKHNYTNLISFLSSILLCLFVMSMSNIWLKNEFLDNMEPYIGTILFLGYIIVDVQYFLHKHVSESEYDINDLHIIASINIYLDVLNIFLRLVEIFAKNKNNKKKE